MPNTKPMTKPITVPITIFLFVFSHLFFVKQLEHIETSSWQYCSSYSDFDINLKLILTHGGKGVTLKPSTLILPKDFLNSQVRI
jgi:hypothetical protein